MSAELEQLEQLERKAAALDAELTAETATPDPAIEQAAQIASSNAQFETMLKQVLGLVVVGASSKYPVIREHYTPAQVAEIAAAFVALCDEYGIDLSAWLGAGGGKLTAWVRLAMAAGLPLLGVLSAIREQRHAPAPPVTDPAQAPTPAMEGSRGGA